MPSPKILRDGVPSFKVIMPETSLSERSSSAFFASVYMTESNGSSASELSMESNTFLNNVSFSLFFFACSPLLLYIYSH